MVGFKYRVLVGKGKLELEPRHSDSPDLEFLGLSGNSRDRYPDLGVRACVRTLSPPNPVPFHGKVW